MKIKFWGVRGSIPVPGPKTVRYGGNTTCIEVRSDDGDLVILDGGTGIFPLAQSLFKACRFSFQFSFPATKFICTAHLIRLAAKALSAL